MTLRARGSGHSKRAPKPPPGEIASSVQKTRFLNALRESIAFDKNAACKKAGINVRDLGTVLAADSQFRIDFENIQAEFFAHLEAMAFDRASRPGGDAILWKMLQIHMPEKYGSANGSGLNVNISADDLSKMSIEELEALKCKVRKT